MFSGGYGLIVDYLAEILKHLRSKDYSQSFRQYFDLSSGVSTRDQAAIVKSISGLVKVLYPGDDCPKEDMKMIMELALEGRKRVKNQLLRIDPDSFSEVDFSYTDLTSKEEHAVLTMEEIQYPQFCRKEPTEGELEIAQDEEAQAVPSSIAGVTPTPIAQELDLMENQKGFNLIDFLGPYLTGASSVKIHDPNLKTLLNLKHFNEVNQFLSQQVQGDDISVELSYASSHEMDTWVKQLDDSLAGTPINLTCKAIDFPEEGSATMEIDTGWKLSFSHGLDVYKSYDQTNPFALEVGTPGQRSCIMCKIATTPLS
jgi:ATP-dependent Lon protease